MFVRGTLILILPALISLFGAINGQESSYPNIDSRLSGNSTQDLAPKSYYSEDSFISDYPGNETEDDPGDYSHGSLVDFSSYKDDDDSEYPSYKGGEDYRGDTDYDDESAPGLPGPRSSFLSAENTQDEDEDATRELRKRRVRRAPQGAYGGGYGVDYGGFPYGGGVGAGAGAGGGPYWGNAGAGAGAGGGPYGGGAGAGAGGHFGGAGVVSGYGGGPYDGGASVGAGSGGGPFGGGAGAGSGYSGGGGAGVGAGGGPYGGGAGAGAGGGPSGGGSGAGSEDGGGPYGGGARAGAGAGGGGPDDPGMQSVAGPDTYRSGGVPGMGFPPGRAVAPVMVLPYRAGNVPDMGFPPGNEFGPSVGFPSGNEIGPSIEFPPGNAIGAGMGFSYRAENVPGIGFPPGRAIAPGVILPYRAGYAPGMGFPPGNAVGPGMGFSYHAGNVYDMEFPSGNAIGLRFPYRRGDGYGVGFPPDMGYPLSSGFGLSMGFSPRVRRQNKEFSTSLGGLAGNGFAFGVGRVPGMRSSAGKSGIGAAQDKRGGFRVPYAESRSMAGYRSGFPEELPNNVPFDPQKLLNSHRSSRSVHYVPPESKKLMQRRRKDVDNILKDVVVDEIRNATDYVLQNNSSSTEANSTKVPTEKTSKNEEILEVTAVSESTVVFEITGSGEISSKGISSSELNRQSIMSDNPEAKIDSQFKYLLEEDQNKNLMPQNAPDSLQANENESLESVSRAIHDLIKTEYQDKDSLKNYEDSVDSKESSFEAKDRISELDWPSRGNDTMKRIISSSENDYLFASVTNRPEIVSNSITSLLTNVPPLESTKYLAKDSVVTMPPSMVEEFLKLLQRFTYSPELKENEALLYQNGKMYVINATSTPKQVTTSEHQADLFWNYKYSSELEDKIHDNVYNKQMKNASDAEQTANLRSSSDAFWEEAHEQKLTENENVNNVGKDAGVPLKRTSDLQGQIVNGTKVEHEKAAEKLIKTRYSTFSKMDRPPFRRKVSNTSRSHSWKRNMRSKFFNRRKNKKISIRLTVSLTNATRNVLNSTGFVFRNVPYSSESSKQKKGHEYDLILYVPPRLEEKFLKLLQNLTYSSKLRKNGNGISQRHRNINNAINVTSKSGNQGKAGIFYRSFIYPSELKKNISEADPNSTDNQDADVKLPNTFTSDTVMGIGSVIRNESLTKDNNEYSMNISDRAANIARVLKFISEVEGLSLIDHQNTTVEPLINATSVPKMTGNIIRNEYGIKSNDSNADAPWKFETTNESVHNVSSMDQSYAEHLVENDPGSDTNEVQQDPQQSEKESSYASEEPTVESTTVPELFDDLTSNARRVSFNNISEEDDPGKKLTEDESEYDDVKENIMNSTELKVKEIKKEFAEGINSTDMAFSKMESPLFRVKVLNISGPRKPESLNAENNSSSSTTPTDLPNAFSSRRKRNSSLRPKIVRQVFTNVTCASVTKGCYKKLLDRCFHKLQHASGGKCTVPSYEDVIQHSLGRNVTNPVASNEMIQKCFTVMVKRCSKEAFECMVEEFYKNGTFCRHSEGNL